jgi:hypothetical protein
MNNYLKVRQQLFFIAEYIKSTRGKGKTTLLKEGVDNYDKKFHIVTVNMEQAKLITKNKKCKPVTLDNLMGIVGSDAPIIIDQEAVAVLAENSLAEMDRIGKVLDSVLEIAEKYQDIYHEYSLKTIEYFSTPWYNFKRRKELKNELVYFDKELEINVLYEKVMEKIT